MAKNWFITGASRGFGREWTTAALERGDRVAATARDIRSLDDLVTRFGDEILPIPLDVTNREADARGQIETNVFGALWITQAALPIMREQGHGHILQVSSIGGVLTYPNLGIYHASKWALEGFSQALSQEVAEFGIHVTIIEPGGYDTDWSGSSAKHATPLAAYDEVRDRRAKQRAGQLTQQGQPNASAAAVLEIVDMKEPPLRTFFGVTPLPQVKPEYEARLANWEKFQPLADKASGLGD